MPAVAWIALGTAIVSVVFNIYNLRKANEDRQWSRSEGARKRNTEIRDQLVEFLDRLRDELREAEANLSAGRDLDELPPALAGARDQFEKFKERLGDGLERSALAHLSGKVELVSTRWQMIKGDRIMHATLTRVIKTTEGTNVPDTDSKQRVLDEISRYERTQHLSRLDLRDSVKAAIQSLSVHIGSLNRASAGAEVRRTGIGFIDATQRLID